MLFASFRYRLSIAGKPQRNKDRTDKLVKKDRNEDSLPLLWRKNNAGRETVPFVQYALRFADPPPHGEPLKGSVVNEFSERT